MYSGVNYIELYPIGVNIEIKSVLMLFYGMLKAVLMAYFE